MWILESNDPELVFRVLSRSLKTVGRAPRAGFVVDAPLVSRLHCRLSMDDDNGLDVEDLGSATAPSSTARRSGERRCRLATP